MKKAKITTVIIAVLALTVLTGETLAQPGRGGRGGRQGWGPGMVDGPRRVQNFQPVQPDNSWVPGPYCPWVQGPNQNIQPRQGRGRCGFGQYFQRPRGPYCPLGQGPNQNIQGRQNRGPGRFNRDFQGRGPGGFNQGFQGRGQGFGRRDMMMQRGPLDGRGGRGFQNAGPGIPGRGGRGFARRNTTPQGWGMNNWRGQPGPGFDRQGPGMRPRWFAPENWNPPVLPRGRGWAPGAGQGWRQGRAPGWGQGWGQNPQPEIAPDANAPEPPIVEDQPEKPQGE